MTAPDDALGLDSPDQAVLSLRSSGPAVGRLPAIDVRRPADVTVPLVFASPHSGRDYPESFIRSSRLDPLTLRKSEDAFVDELFGAAPDFGAPLLRALFPRAYVDANREAFELDPQMFEDRLPSYVNTHSPRVAAGLGTVARVVATGADIYPRKLRFSDAVSMIERCHTPYHRALQALIDDSLKRFASCLFIDCHSMPSSIWLRPEPQGGHNPSTHANDGPAYTQRDEGGKPPADIILGDGHGTTCAPFVVSLVERKLRSYGYRVSRNDPYAGGFCTRHYGQPSRGVHCLQIEINRALYMDERRIVPSNGFAQLRRHLSGLIETLAAIPAAALCP